jgi:hypothetical protein
MAAVSNSSPLILYSRIGRLELLRSLFTEILIPPAVWREIVEDGANRAGSIEVLAADWIHRQPLPSSVAPVRIGGLDPGEREAIALASSFQPAVSIPSTIVARGVSLRKLDWLSLAAPACLDWRKGLVSSHQCGPFSWTSSLQGSDSAKPHCGSYWRWPARADGKAR